MTRKFSQVETWKLYENHKENLNGDTVSKVVNRGRINVMDF